MTPSYRGRSTAGEGGKQSSELTYDRSVTLSKGSFMARAHLFRWAKRTQFDMPCRAGWLSLGLDRTRRWRLVAYWSPDATPMHPRARGLG
jgi:hypothetical protein